MTRNHLQSIVAAGALALAPVAGAAADLDEGVIIRVWGMGPATSTPAGKR